jgi:formate dehydrogenase alpha subunit
VTACTEPVAEGMIVHTDTSEVRRLQRTAAELLIAAECPDCSACLVNRHCELQKIAAFVGVRLKPKRLRPTPKALPIDDSNPFFIRDSNKCVLCGKCVWVCSEVVGADAIDFTYRGFDAVLRPFDIGPTIDETCVKCGECVAICPVGALVPKDLVWPDEEVRTVCPHCAVGCGIYLGTDASSVVNVRGDEDNPVNRGTLCVNGRFGIAEIVHHQDRLTSPMVKKGRRFEQVSWAEAIDLVASQFTKYQGERFGLISSARLANEDSYVLQKFARVAMGSNNIDNSARLYDAPSRAALGHSFGSAAMSHPIGDIEGAACIFAIGTNPTSSHPILGQHVIRAAKKGARLIVANPREIDLCRHASLWLRNRPGSDLALLMGMMRIIIDEGLADLSFIEERCENFALFRDSVKDFGLEVAEKLSGVPRQTIAEAARAYTTGKPAVIIYGSGITQHIGGTENVFVLANLAMLTGNMGRSSYGVSPLKRESNAQGACDMGVLPGFLPGYRGVADADARAEFEEAWGHLLSPNPGLSLGEMVEAAHEGDIKALYIAGDDPALDMANVRRVRQALRKLKFLVVQDIFLSETARLAHIVLPAAGFAERSGTFTNTERRMQLLRQAIEPIGDSRPDWWIACQIALKLGISGFDFKNPSHIMDEIAGLNPDYGGISYKRLGRESVLCPYPSQGKGRFMPVEFTLPPQPDADYPLLLTTERSLYHLSAASAKVKGLETLRPEELVEISPADAVDLGIGDGEAVRVISPRGEVKVKARVIEASPPGVVSMSGRFPRGQVNLLTDSALDPVSKIPELKLCLVRIERIR